MIRRARLCALFIFVIYCIIAFGHPVDSIIIGFAIACIGFLAHVALIITPYREEYVDALFEVWQLEMLELPQNEERPVWYYLVAHLAWMFPPLVVGAYSGYFIELETWTNNTSNILVVLGIIYAAMLTRSNKSAPLTNLDTAQTASMKEMYQKMIRMNHLIGILTVFLIIILFAPTALPTQNIVVINILADDYSPINVNSAVIGFMLSLILITVAFTALAFDCRTINRQR